MMEQNKLNSSGNTRYGLTIPLFLISFFLAFNYYVLIALKETLIITAKGSGAEAIPFVKVWLLLPASILLAGGFAWMTSRFTLRTAFTATLSLFLLSYFLFTFILFPFREEIHLHTLADRLQILLPAGWKGLVAVVRYWSYALFYVMAECWGVIVYSVLFWGFANEVTKIVDAQRSYPILTLAGTVAALVAGPVAFYLSANPYFPLGNTPWEQSLYALTLMVLGCGIAALLTFHLFFPKEILSLHALQRKKKQSSLSFWKSFVYLAQSKYLLAIALVVFSFNMMINMTEVVWKDQLLKLYPNPNDFNAYMSTVTTSTGVISTLLTLFVCRQSLRNFGWTTTAMITPIIALITGALFCGAILIKGGNIAMIAFLGSTHICLSFSGKYTLLDTTKELAFIPLDSEQRLKGKAAIDGVGTRLGKASSSMIFQCLLASLPSITACTPYISGIFLFTLLICILSIHALGKKVEAKEQVA